MWLRPPRKPPERKRPPEKTPVRRPAFGPEKMDPSFQGSRPECFKIWVIRNLRFPADRYDVGDEAKVEVVFAIDKNGTLTDLKVTHCEERAFCRPALQDDRPVAEMVARTDEGEAVKTELEMRFVFRLVAPPAGQEELGLCAEECDIHTTADRMPLFCGGGPDGFRAWVQRQVDSLMGPGALMEPRKLILRFVVGKDGRVTPAPKPKYRDEDALEQTVRQAIAAAPAWTPATIDGERVRFGVSMPVAFGPGAAGAEYSDKDAYRVVEVMPKFFGGGLDKFRSWVMAEVRYPSDMLKRGVQGRVVAAFVVDKEGRITMVEILESPHPQFSEAVARVLGRAPRWTPGRQDGALVRVEYTLPVDFKIRSEQRFPTGAAGRNRGSSRSY